MLIRQNYGKLSQSAASISTTNLHVYFYLAFMNNFSISEGACVIECFI